MYFKNKVMGKQHVQIPNKTVENTTSERGSKDKKFYTDLLVYACLKKYMVAESGISLVSLRKISDESGISLGGVQTAIQRLIDAKDINKIKVPGRNQNGYTFNKTSEKFEMFDKEFLENKDLTNLQKAFMIMIQPHLFINKASGIGKTTYSTKELAQKTGLSERVINDRKRELESTGFISRRLTTDKVGNSCEALEFNLPKFGQYVLCKLDKLEKDVDKTMEQLSAMQMKINQLESIIKMSTPYKLDVEDAIIEL